MAGCGGSGGGGGGDRGRSLGTGPAAKNGCARPGGGAAEVPSAGVAVGSSQPERLFLMFQLVDNLLPIGGFSHSQGLESALQSGAVRKGDEAGLASFLRVLVQNAAYQSGPLVSEAARALGPGGAGVDRAAELDLLAHALLAGVPPARDASLAMGRNLLRLARESFAGDAGGLGGGGGGGGTGIAALAELAPANAGAPRGHFGVAFGAVCAAGGLDPPEALRMFLFSSARDALSAATRLNILGPLAAQRVLRDLGAFLEAVAGEAAALPAGAAGAASPLAGLLQASHPQLCSRLFQS